MEFYRTFRKEKDDNNNQKNKKNKTTKNSGEATSSDSNSTNSENIAKPKNKNLMKNLIALKKLVTQPKEKEPNKRFNLMKEYLHNEELKETVKIDKWVPTIYCPKCRSTDLSKIIKNIHNEDKFTYKCNQCEHEFSEGSDSPFDTSKIPLKTWMECWYLLGLTNSVDYIAAKLHLDIELVKVMIVELQRVFKVQQPLSKFLSYDDWYGESSYFLEKIKEQIIDKHDQLLGKVAINQEKDTAEERRQKQRRKFGGKPMN